MKLSPNPNFLGIFLISPNDYVAGNRRTGTVLEEVMNSLTLVRVFVENGRSLAEKG